MPLPNEHSCRRVDPDRCISGSWKSESGKIAGKPVRRLFAKLKTTKERTLQSIRFPTKHWSASQAKKYCTGRFEPAKK